MPRISNPRPRASTVRQPREVHRHDETSRTAGPRKRTVQPKESALLNAAEGFAMGALVGWELPYLKAKVALGDRTTELLSPALLLAQGASAFSIGVVCGAARLLKGSRSY
jgi:hypothetical protein